VSIFKPDPSMRCAIMRRPSLTSLLVAPLRCEALVARGLVEDAFICPRAHSRSLAALLLSRDVHSWSPPPEPVHAPPPTTPLDVLYRTSVVPKDDFSLIQQHASSLLLLGGSRDHPRLCDEASSVAVGRQGMTLDRATPDRLTTKAAAAPAFQLVQILDLHVKKILLKQTGREYRLCDDVPAELRVYQKRGAGMAWHQDDVLYDPPQVEVVFTIENTSNCATRWKKGPDDDDDEASVETDPNSALVIAAGGPWHCVTSLQRGRRVIVKLAYVLPGAQRVELSPPRKDATRRRRK
jgi:hypothetical protein